MQNFVFHNPTKIIFGQGTIPQIGPETAALAKRVLLVYGRDSIKKNGVYAQVMTALNAAGLEVIEHGGVKPNPILSHVHAGITLAKQKKIDGVVAVGGGSVIDSAKAISAGALVEHDIWKFFTGRKSVCGALPLTCVLTLAASSSEMNSAMVITNEKTNQKFGFANRLLFPRTSILDPTATLSVPRHQAAYGAVDAVSHLLECYCTTTEPFNPVQDRLMEGLAANLMESCGRILAAPNDYQARADFMWAATLSLNGLTAAGLGKIAFPMHLIEHALSALYDVPHGAGLSVVIPGWLTWQAQRNPARLARFAERVFQIVADDDLSKATQGIDRLKAWFAAIDCPTDLAGIGVSAATIPEIAKNASTQATIWRMCD